LEDATYLGLNESDRCNYNCLKCVQGVPDRTGTELSIDSFIEIVESARLQLGIKALFVAGKGETFLAGRGETEEDLLDNYRRLIECTNSMGVHVLQFTNGYYLDKNMVDFLKDKDVSLVVSVDTLDEGKYHALKRGPSNSFERVMANLQYAREQFSVDNVEGYSVYKLAVNMALSGANLHDVDEMKEYCGDDVMFICNYPIKMGCFSSSGLCNSDEEYERIKNIALSVSDNGGMSGTTLERKCGFIHNGFGVDSNGNILLCAYDPSTGQLFGNVNDYRSLDDAFRRVRRAVVAHSAMFPDSRICFLRDLDSYVEFPKSVP